LKLTTPDRDEEVSFEEAYPEPLTVERRAKRGHDLDDIYKSQTPDPNKT
jgi:hypothetical protein